MIGEQFLTERDQQVFAQSGYGRKMELGKKPVFLVIDCTYEFTGPERESVFEAMKKVRTGVGEDAWVAVDNIQRMLPCVREAGIPIIYTKIDKSAPNPFVKKNVRSGGDSKVPKEWAEIVDELAPQPEDEVIAKVSPSAFFGTNLIYSLLCKNCDTLIVVGGVTSGCVRCTVTDAFSYGFKIAVVQDGVFDRGQASGEMSLYDMNAKYANVISEQDLIDYVKSLSANE